MKPLSEYTHDELRRRATEIYDRAEALVRRARVEGRERLSVLDTQDFDTAIAQRDLIDKELESRGTTAARVRRALAAAGPDLLEEFQRTACHEAGHAIAMVLSGVTVRSVAITPIWRGDDLSGFRGQVSREDGASSPYINLAGYAAESRHFGAPPPGACLKDFQRAQESLGPGVFMQPTLRKLDRDLGQAWRAMGALAAALEARLHLDGKEAEEIIRANLPVIGRPVPA